MVSFRPKFDDGESGQLPPEDEHGTPQTSAFSCKGKPNILNPEPIPKPSNLLGTSKLVFRGVYSGC